MRQLTLEFVINSLLRRYHCVRRLTSGLQLMLTCHIWILIILHFICSSASTSTTSLNSQAFLINSSSSVLILETLYLKGPIFNGFSFRTCSSGTLLHQTGDNGDQIQIILDNSGAIELKLSFLNGGGSIQSLKSSNQIDGLNDARWHSIFWELGVEPQPFLRLFVDDKVTYELDAFQLNRFDLAAKEPKLRIGGIHGPVCIKEGPGVRFTKPEVSVTSHGVRWDGDCFLPLTCQDGLLDASISNESCHCKNNGICSLDGGSSTCICPSSFTGPSCASTADCLCRNGGSCIIGNTNAICNCSGTGYTGKFCHEDDACLRLGEVCLNDGKCLHQPYDSGDDNYLCDCKNGFYGKNCHKFDGTRHLTNSVSSNCYVGLCKNNGSCWSSSAPSRFTCTCPPGFTGEFCELLSCSNVNCPDNSLCYEGKCQCNAGFQDDPKPPHRCVRSLSFVDPCENDNYCQNGGSCVIQNGGIYSSLTTNTTFDKIKCLCLPGFMGAFCQDKIEDDCHNLGCMNGGNCRKVSGSEKYTCFCQPGFTGSVCQTQSGANHSCNSNLNSELETCNHHGECIIDTDGSNKCQCHAGFKGVFCEIDIDECEMYSCQNGGTCVDLRNTFRCNCPDGFTGQTCNINIDECESNPCLNGGQCIDQVNGFKCECTSEYMGSVCASLYDPCENNPCLNLGSCLATKSVRDPGNDFKCVCINGFEGDLCEINTDDCNSVECPLGHICLDQIGTYECICPAGLTGPNCSLSIDECSTQPCKNNASCIELKDGYRCNCIPGWTGQHCESDIDECALNSTLCNYGICKNKLGSYQCYCRPGYTGSHCSFDFDECLSGPCQNEGNCTNLVNKYACSCLPGYDGVNCENDINECFTEPCLNGAICVDLINAFRCDCASGFEGDFCQIDIDECMSDPCQNGGKCIDAINAYTCNCNGTGYEGINCESNIDECLQLPCRHNSTCIDKINDYSCTCYPGYTGKNCQVDVSDCSEVSHCLNGAVCLEHSNTSLYRKPGQLVSGISSAFPPEIKQKFDREFSYDLAHGYTCHCSPGYSGNDCEINIDECSLNPCLNGDCIDGIAEFHCRCYPGYEGNLCQIEIDECQVYQPCVHGSCQDSIADYACSCTPEWGGKNCSVLLMGCQDVVCLNGGTCTPWLQDEKVHRGNCTCKNGFSGLRCHSRTTFSLSGSSSYIKVPSIRSDGYELHLRFRTTLGNGLVAIGQGNTHFILQLHEGSLNLFSNLIAKYEGMIIGSNLNNTNWHKVYVAVNGSHLTLGVNDRLQATQPINPNGENDTVFYNTFLGGIVEDQIILTNNAPPFVGCIQDITVNGIIVTEEDVKDSLIQQINTVPGCVRVDQCNPNPCQNEGSCSDLWKEYKCACNRPFLGLSCQESYTAATFGHENITNSLAIVDISHPERYMESIDISMFIRTRKTDGFIFYIGNDPGDVNKAPYYISGQLLAGKFVVNVNVEGKMEKFQVYKVGLADGFRHFIQVVRTKTTITIKVNQTVSTNQEIASSPPFVAEKLYLGNYLEENAYFEREEDVTSPPLEETPSVILFTPAPLLQNLDRSRRQLNPVLNLLQDHHYFKGIIQDVQISNGEDFTDIIDLFISQSETNLTSPRESGGAHITLINVKEGEVSDDTCAISPCQNGGVCHITWNDYNCECLVGYKGRDCELKEYCFWFSCPNSSKCISLNDGHECVSNATFNGLTSSIMYRPHFLSNSHETSTKFTTKFRTKNQGTIMQAFADSSTFIRVRIMPTGHLQIMTGSESYVSHQEIFNDGAWHSVEVYFESNVETFSLIIDGTEQTGHNLTTSFDSFYEFILHPAFRIVLGAGVHQINAASVSNTSSHSLKMGDYFQGCIGPSRISSILLPFYSRKQLVNVTSSNTFEAVSLSDLVSNSDCIVCQNEKCENGGFCSNPIDMFECSCPEGFEGNTCGTNIDECTRDACKYGNCIDGIANFTCDCYTGWSGNLCDKDLDECEAKPCKNGGICRQTVLPGNYTCLCSDEYEGQNCEELKIKSCAELPCKNGATCMPNKSNILSTNYIYFCDCTTGFKGIDCEIKKDFCAENHQPCLNGATCYSDDLTFNYKCSCPIGFKGQNCEIDIDDCVAQPCYNGGLCLDGINDFHCDCKETGYSGQLCKDNIDECQQLPCVHGNCSDNNGSYSCSCRSGYCGFNCDRKNPCLEDTSLCKNDGICVPSCDVEAHYYCRCGDSWSGQNCAVKAARETASVAMIVGPIVGGMIFMALIGMMIFLVMARKRRKSEGKYKPASQELTSPRLQLDNMLKLPPEERLI